jgi:ELWxxDGT repeat protein
VFFEANGETHGRELWKTDGTAAGTQRVTDINPDGGHANPDNLDVYANHLLFRANDGTNGRELWKTDGTGDGTALVKDITPGSAGTTFGEDIVF